MALPAYKGKWGGRKKIKMSASNEINPGHAAVKAHNKQL